MAATVIVENTEDRVHCIGDLPLRVDPIASASPGAPPPPKDALLPGVNEVDATAWAQAEKIPVIRDHYLKKGILKVRKGETSADLPKLSPDEAIELVKKTFDEGLLKRFLDNEKRRSVIEVITAQLEEIRVTEQKARGGK